MKSGLRLGRQQRGCIAAVALLAVALVALALGGCGDTATDKNEPNDDLNSAHALAPGAPADGVIGPGDSDVFACDAPEGNVTHSFVVTVRTEAPQGIELQVGGQHPGCMGGHHLAGVERRHEGRPPGAGGDAPQGDGAHVPEGGLGHHVLHRHHLDVTRGPAAGGRPRRGQPHQPPGDGHGSRFFGVRGRRYT